MTVDQYLEERVDSKITYYTKASKNSKKKHSSAQVTIIALGLIVPVAVNLEHEWFSSITEEFLRIMVTLLSLATAVVSGIANFKKYGELWIIYQMTLEQLSREKNFFLTHSEKYREEKGRFNLFVESIEKILAVENDQLQTLAKDKHVKKK